MKALSKGVVKVADNLIYSAQCLECVVCDHVIHAGINTSATGPQAAGGHPRSHCAYYTAHRLSGWKRTAVPVRGRGGVEGVVGRSGLYCYCIERHS